MALTPTEATAVPPPFWILVAEWMNLFGDPIETSSAVAPAVSVGSHIPSVSTYTYIESAYICISTRYLQSACFFRKFSFLLLFFFLHSVTLSRSCNPKRVNLVKQKAQERDSPNQVSDNFLFKHVPLQTNKGKKKKRYFLFAVFVWSLILDHLFRCQFREVDSKSGRKNKAASSPCSETTRPHGSRHRNTWTSAWADPLTKPVQVPVKGKEAERNASTPLPSIQSNCSKLLLSYFLQVLIWTVWVSCFYYYYVFPTLRKWLQKNTDQDRLFYFTFSYFFFPFPIEPKGNPIPKHLPPPTHSFSCYAKLKMAIPYYSHNGRDSVCVWLCVICLLFFFFKLWICVKSEVTC